MKCKLNLFPIFQSFASCSHLQVRNATKKRKRATGGGRSTQGSRAGSVHGGISVGSSPLGKPRKRHASRAGSVSSVIVSNLKTYISRVIKINCYNILRGELVCVSVNFGLYFSLRKMIIGMILVMKKTSLLPPLKLQILPRVLIRYCKYH